MLNIKLHIGTLLILVFIFWLTWLFNNNLERLEYKWYIPIAAGAFIWLTVEVFMWIIYFFLT